MRILVAPDKFKGSISAVAAAEAIQRGFAAVFREAEIELSPIADGGEGFADALRTALGGEWVKTQAHDPLGRTVEARYVWIAETSLAVIEMSEASGYWRVKPEEREPLRATTYGTGQLMRHAVKRGAKTILVGLGGSATTDGGIGMAEALGYRFLTSDGEELEAIPGNLLPLTRIDVKGAIELPTVIAACDVQNPLLGARGTARVFSPQKGADARTVETLELALENLADVVKQDLECDFRDSPGAGAAGGIGFGLMTFCQASVRSGFDVVAEALRLEERIAAADLVITGEGRLDDQTLDGKGPAGIAALARLYKKPVLGFAGSVADLPELRDLFDLTCPIVDEVVKLDEAMRRGAEFLERAAFRTARALYLGTTL
ncbi:MAG TPA: glycerate kinase [Chthoniobacteraceae bacterium]|jgi:glycerate kinase